MTIIIWDLPVGIQQKTPPGLPGGVDVQCAVHQQQPEPTSPLPGRKRKNLAKAQYGSKTRMGKFYEKKRIEATLSPSVSGVEPFLWKTRGDAEYFNKDVTF
jgi:hypothetical protein